MARQGTADAETAANAGHGSLALGIACGVLAAAVWGAAPIIMRYAVQHDLPAADVVAVRFAASGLLLLPLVWKRGSCGLGWPRAMLLACGAGAPALLLTTWGLTLAPAGHDGVITPSCMLLFSTLGAWLWLGERVDGTRLIGLGAVLLGVALIGWDSLETLGLETLEGDLLFVAAGLLWSGYTLGVRAWGVSALDAAALIAVVSMVFYLPLYLLFLEPKVHLAPAWEILMIAGGQGLLAGILAIIFYTRAIKILGAGRGALFNALIPVVVLIVAVPVLDEVPSLLELVGVGVVTLGMIAALGLLKGRAKAASGD